MLLLIDNEPGNISSLIEDNEIRVVFMSANAIFILQTPNQRLLIISTAKSYNLRNTFHKAMTAIDGDSSDRSEQSELKTSGKDSLFWKPLKTSVNHGNKSTHQH